MPIEEDKKEKLDVSPEMMSLFLEEFKRDFQALQEAAQEGSLPDAKKALKGILGSVKIVHFDSLVPLLESLLSLGEVNSDMLHGIEQLDPLSRASRQTVAQVVDNMHTLPAKSAQKSQEPVVEAAGGEVDLSLVDLFYSEVEAQVSVLNQGLLILEGDECSQETYKTLMRAAHSIKGAARVVNLSPLITLGHALEDCFVALEAHPDRKSNKTVETLFQSVDFFSSLLQVPKEFLTEYLDKQTKFLKQLSSALRLIIEGKEIEEVPIVTSKVGYSEERAGKSPAVREDRVLRVSTKRLNGLMGLAGESKVESLWLQPFGEALTSLKQIHAEMVQSVDQIREALKGETTNPQVNHHLSELHHHANVCQQTLDNRLSELEMFIRRHTSLSERLYGEVIDIRMRPLSDGVKGFPRIVRDIGRDLGKKVRLEIIGEDTPVDRDILDKLETPLMHLLRNAVDHGIEPPDERAAQGKSQEGVVTLQATHRSGMLYITITDDGKGVDLEAIKSKVIEEKIVNEEVIGNLTEAELLDFLFLPGFTTSQGVTEISGRGMGLNIVQNMIQEVGGTIRTATTKGRHLSFELQLPLTLSVIRSLLVEVGGEPYAFPLARIVRSIHLPRSQIEVVEDRQFFQSDGKNVGLVHASQVLELGEDSNSLKTLPVVMLNDRMNLYGVIVDKFCGEKDLVVQDIDPILGKLPGISSGAFMEDGSPLLIIDVEDILRSIDKVFYSSSIRSVSSQEAPSDDVAPKRILVVDDSITVREVECRLLQNRGYEVQTAVDGVDGWNAVRIGEFDLVITDVDMPRMNGIDLVLSIKSDLRLNHLPVMIVSYKDRENDRKLGLEAGADYYLTKASFHDETLVDAVINLIGAPGEPKGS